MDSRSKNRNRLDGNYYLILGVAHYLSFERRVESSKVSREHLNKSRDINGLNKEIYEISNKRMLEISAGELSAIHKLWNETGVTESYRNIFENIALDLDALVRDDYFKLEIASLKKFEEHLMVIETFLNFRN